MDGHLGPRYGWQVIDALLHTLNLFKGDAHRGQAVADKFPYLDPRRRMILVTGHRRENFDGGLERVFRALAVLAKRSDVQIVFPVHLNPKVQEAVGATLKSSRHVHLTPPAPYQDFVWLMDRSHFIVSPRI